ncbi:hypothetical protein FA95DRAFT_1553988 [Auriscalpium vulgare]|uniref:Uncharacterized protein n=1 Tax=Auriscalpium vulgare TaxID=40419 RepID=A0ACB8S823_9AGAM|nr:hypothetical protein FA95DRAFT_1553988 [Auriscalpium vulgare]
MSFLRRRFRSRSANGTQSTQAIQMTPPAGASSCRLYQSPRVAYAENPQPRQ